jgi:predicted ABC-type ATPase
MASPTVLIVGGPNGAGKTTLAEPYAEQKDRPYLAADRIASELNPEDPYAARVEAGRQFLRRLNAFIEKRTSFVVESTLAGRSLARSIDRMNEAGYVTRIAFVVLDSADLCVRRVQERVRKGGHHVPDADVRRRYTRSKKNFWTLYRPKVDRWILFRNTGQSLQRVAEGDGDTQSVLRQSGYEKFFDNLSLSP